MLPVLQVGPLAVQLPGLLLLLGLWLASVVIGRNAWRHGLDGDVLDRLLLIGLLAGGVGARLSYALQHASDFAADPRAILSLSLTAFAPFEGAAIGLVAVLVYGARRSLPFWTTVDALTPGAALLAVFVHLSQLASGDAFGAPADLPWAIELWGERRHPAQLYALAASIAILGFVLWLQRRRRFAGELALGWLALSSAARLLLEASRGDSLYLAGVRQAQLAALVVLMASLAGLHVLARRTGNPPPMHAPGAPEQSAPG